MENNLPHEPQSYKQIIKCSLRLYQLSFTRVIMLALFLSLTVFIPRFLSLTVGDEILLNLSPLSWQRIWLSAINIVALIFFIGILWRMHCVLNKKREPLLEDFSVAFHKIISVLVAGFIQAFIIILVSLIIYGLQYLLVQQELLFSNHLIGIIFTISVFALEVFIITYTICLFTFLIPLIAIENKNIFTSIQKSFLLAYNHWVRIITVQITPWIAYVIFLLLLRFALNIDIHIYLIEQKTHHFLPSIFHMLAFALFIPWVAALLIVQLNDLEIRNKTIISKVNKRKK